MTSNVRRFRGYCFQERICYRCSVAVDLERRTLTIRLGPGVMGVLIKTRGEPSLRTLSSLSRLKGVWSLSIDLRSIESVRKYQVSGGRDLKECFKIEAEGNQSIVEITYGRGMEVRILLSDNDAVRLNRILTESRG